jgi:type IV pilus assembly protein PilB
MAAAATQLVEKLIAALSTEASIDSSRLAEAIERGFARGVNPVRAVLDSGVGLEVLERVAWWHQGYDVAEIDVNAIDPSFFARFPVTMAKAYNALPLGQGSEGFLVAVADPDNLTVLDDIRKRFAPTPVKVLVADAQAIAAALSSMEHRAVATELNDDAEDSIQVLQQANEEDAGDGKVAQMVSKTIEMAVSYRSSDIHIEPADDHVRVRIRVDGVLKEIARYPMSAGQGIINNLKVRAGLDVAERRQPQDGRITTTVAGRVLDLRLVTLPNVWRCEGAVMRILDRSRSVVTLEQLGYSSRVKSVWERLSASPYGALLATGPTGSGKTTSLYATLSRIATSEVKVCTVEDPVEYRFPGLMQMQVDVKAGRTFAAALKSFLRADPDVILVGEIRDTITANTAVEAALTGHLLLASLHANTACTAPTRLIEMGIEPYLVGSAVRGVLSQRLTRKLCTNCRRPIPPPLGAFESLGEGVQLPEHIYKANDKGCNRCGGQGYTGRIAIAEVLEVTEPVSFAIANGANGGDLLKIAKQDGMVPMYQEGLYNVLDGITSLEELARVIN